VRERVVLWFEIVDGRSRGQVFPIRSATDFVRIGRCSTCTVFFPSPTVAKHHALLIQRQSQYLSCCRLKRGYHTRLNGREVTPPFAVLVGDELQVGEFTLRFREGNGPA
jgi:pSer/pThr/pTyr-binding forkhead associated (FHA) protein